MPLDISNLLYSKVKDDEAFIVSELFSLASGSTGNVHIKNPSTSSATLWIADITISGDSAFVARVHDGFSSAPSGGTSAAIQALLLDSESVDNDGEAIANRNVSYTSSSQHAVGVSGGGGSGSTVGGTREHALIAIEPGRELVVDVENTASNAGDYAISIVYVESPQ